MVLNAHRVPQDRIPSVFDGWDIIWYGDDECVGQAALDSYAPASKWIGMNTLSIDPETVMVPEEETHLMSAMEKHGITPVPVKMRHMRTLAGGPHCVSVDLVREGKLEQY